MDRQVLKSIQQERRKHRVRNKLLGTAERPRLSVFRSNKHIYAQIIDDDQGVTLAAAGSLGKNAKINYGGNKAAAVAIGKAIAEAAKSKGITKVCFDRSHYKYHGRIKALADAAREGGLQF
jgi:large subunit ribosomal protein L18